MHHVRIGDDDLQIRIAFIATKSDETSASDIANSLRLHTDASFKRLRDEVKSREARRAISARPMTSADASTSKRVRSRSPEESEQSPMKKRKPMDEYDKSNVISKIRTNIDSKFSILFQA